jgi:tRNA-modifying protein YgfZ
MTTRIPDPIQQLSPTAGQAHESLAQGYAAAHTAAVMSDLSSRGRIQVTGRDRLDLLQRLTTNDMKSLAAGQGVVNLFLTNKGRIVEMCDVLAFPEHLLVVLASAKGGALVEWIERYVFMEDVQAADLTADTYAIGIFGPKAAAVLAAAGIDVTGLANRDHRRARLEQLEGGEITVGLCEPLAGTGYRLLGRRSDAAALAAHLAAAAARAGIGLANADQDLLEVLRIEAGWPAAEHELTEEWNPLETELRPFISFTKGCYTGQEVIARLNTYKKVQRALRGLRIAGPDGGNGPTSPTAIRVPAPGSALRDSCGAPAGVVTSAAYSPGLNAAIALALVELAQSAPGTRIEVDMGGTKAAAEVVGLPFALTAAA